MARDTVSERTDSRDGAPRSLCEVLATWTGADPVRLESLIAAEVAAGPVRRLTGASVVGGRGRLERRLGFVVSRVLTPPARRRLLGFAKRLTVRPGQGDGLSVDGLELVQLVARLRRDLKLPADGVRGLRVFVTHDVDWPECYAAVGRLADVEERVGVRSSFNFLTAWGYRLERQPLEDLRRRGFEIGLHGLTHDAALGFRSTARIRAWLERALGTLGTLGVEVVGFRAPALAFGPRLAETLDDLGFRYDSSLAVFDGSTRGIGTIYPYRFPGQRLVEFPLALQDSTLFREMRLDDARALGLVQRLLREFRVHGGCFVFNGHPGILREHMTFYSGFLDLIRGERVRTLRDELDRDPSLVRV